MRRHLPWVYRRPPRLERYPSKQSSSDQSLRLRTLLSTTAEVQEKHPKRNEEKEEKKKGRETEQGERERSSRRHTAKGRRCVVFGVERTGAKNLLLSLRTRYVWKMNAAVRTHCLRKGNIQREGGCQGKREREIDTNMPPVSLPT